MVLSVNLSLAARPQKSHFFPRAARAQCARLQAACALCFSPIVQARPSSALAALNCHKSDSFYRGNIALFFLSFPDRSIDRFDLFLFALPSRAARLKPLAGGGAFFPDHFIKVICCALRRHYGSQRTPPDEGKGFASRSP